MDKRISRTKRLLSEALIGLLQSTSMEQVSIKSICAEAMVHRTTFYKYFEDKGQLLLYYFDCQIDEILAKIEQNNASMEVLKSFFLLCVDYVDSKRELFRNLNSYNVDHLHIFFVSLFKQKIREALAKSTMQSSLNEVAVDFFAGGIVSMLVSWEQNNYKYTKQQMIDYFNYMMKAIDAFS